MLEPEDRHYFSDLLAPPAGFRLQKAVGATYSLELPAFLLAPVAMSNQSVDEAVQHGRDGVDESDDERTPVSLVEAIRRIADRVALCCQRGRIKVPKSHSELYAFLDEAILELDPEDGAFHPKFWLLHFTDDETSRYRLVCTSRNLAYNRTWDAVVALEGSPNFDNGASGRPMAAFLGRTAVRSEVSQGAFDRRGVLEAFVDDLASVTFRAPQPFEDASLRLRGWENRAPLYGTHPSGSQSLWVSPFVSRGALDRLLEAGESGAADETVLVSRQESLDDLHEQAGSDWPGWDRLDCRVLSIDEALRAGESEDDLVGLHAKVYGADAGDECTWRFTSANLTNAAFGGGNIEFGVDLQTGAGRAPVADALRSSDDREMGFGNLLEPYHPADEPTDDAEREAEQIGESWRSFFAGGTLSLEASQTADGAEYDVELEFRADRPRPDQPLASGRAWLSSLAEEIDAREFPTGRAISQFQIDLGAVTALKLTPFVAFELELSEPVRHATRFVLGAQLHGVQIDRTDAVLEHLIRNRERFLQYLQYLLADADDYWTVRTQDESGVTQTSSQSRSRGVELPLMEDVVEKCVDAPAKVDAIHSLVQSVRDLESGEELVPTAFLEDVWLPVLRALKPELVDEYCD